jgi:putative ATP-dependent endonuclease of OLD family
LEISAALDLHVAVATDNDGDATALEAKFKEYTTGKTPNIRICFDRDEATPTLEPQLLKANSVKRLNKVFGTSHTRPSLLKYMTSNKTACAMQLFETTEPWTAPEYILNAIE